MRTSLIALCLAAMAFFSCTEQEKDPNTFYFGNGKLPAGVQTIANNQSYSDSIGYGFDFLNIAQVKMDKNCCYSDQAFYFSVKAPEGIYKVDITLGSQNHASNTFVKAESRRLMLSNINAQKGESVHKTIMLDIRTPKVNENKSIILKKRDMNNLDWDNRLTLEFGGKNPSVQAIKVTPIKVHVPTIFLSGNSTVTDQDHSPWASWGQMITQYLSPDIVVANYAESGSTLAAFKGVRRLEKVLNKMQPGDYFFIEFGHNDQKRKGEGIGPWTSFSDLLREYITKAREKGGIPILVTPTQRRSFNKEGIIQETHGDYPDAMRAVGKELNVPIIEVHIMTKQMYEAWGIEASKKAFVQYPAHTFPGQDKELKDNTHFNEFGANEVAQCVIQGIIDLNLPLKKYIINPDFSYDPTHPNLFTDWNVPMSPRFVSTKPAGN